MPYYESITKVVLNGPATQGGGSAPIVATFQLAEITNKEHALSEGIATIQQIASLLGWQYENMFTRGQEGEQFNECFIYHYEDSGKDKFFIKERNWSQAQVLAFRGIIRILANLYGWQLEDQTEQT